MRDREDRSNRWLAAVNGIDLGNDGQNQTAYDLVEEKKRNIEAQRLGMTSEQFDLDEFGVDMEIEE